MKFLFILFVTNTFAFTDPNFYSSTIIDLEEIFEDDTSDKIYKSRKHILTENALAALEDKNKVIDENFEVPNYFKSNVYFWFSIYTQYSSKQVLIHDKSNLDLIYRVLDFSEIHESDLNIFTKFKIQNQLTKESVKKLKQDLKNLSIGKQNESNEYVITILNEHGVAIPKSPIKAKTFYLNLATNLRTQTGQKNMIYKGVINSEIYLEYLQRIMGHFKIPTELIGIAFLESSFNYKAMSRVGASGIWQFMPYIANLFMPKITNHVDYRSNPVISSISAFHLLRQNYKILKRWDLAVPAYNSGTKHLIKAKRKFKNVKNVDLAYILENYNHPHLGFASQNFYSEFLALVHALKYKNTFFNVDGSLISKKVDNSKVEVYVSRCKFRTPKLAKRFGANIIDLNPQFDSKSVIYPQRSLIVSDKALPNAYFYKLPIKTIEGKFPKHWHQGVTIKSCNFI